MSEDPPRTYLSGPSDPVRLADGPGTWVRTSVAAPVDRVWSAVTDLDLPARFSTEFRGASWTSEPGPGGTFTGRNSHEAIGEWEVPCFVLAWQPGREFGWGTSDPANPGATWRYRLAADGEAHTELTFELTIGPGRSGISAAIARMPEKEPRILARRLAEHHANMVRTVEGIRAVCESP